MTRRPATTSPPDLAEARSWLEGLVRERLEPLLGYATTLQELADGSPLAAPTLERCKPQVEAIIDSFPGTIGAGFIAAPFAVDAAERYVHWLQRRGDVIRKLRLNFDTSDPEAYDYVHMDWYVQTEERGEPTLTGPYLDYSGSNALVLTLAAPVASGTTFLGVVATDLLAQAAENLIASRLCEVTGDVLVVNRDRTVVATNSVRWMPGERLKAMPGQKPGSFEAVLPISSWTGWQLARARAER